MKLLELHIVQSFPVTCLNRDDVGAPKSAVFGGAPRARVSSQSWKRAIRELAAGTNPEFFGGRRGRHIASRISEALMNKGVDSGAAQKAANEIATFLGEHDPKYKDGHRTKTAVYFSPMEIDVIAQAVAEDLANGGSAKPGKGSLKKALKTTAPKDMADIALFGRMVASDHTLMVEGAGMFSHALSTHKVSNEIDFFSVVDDFKPEDSEGAGHIGTLEFNAATYYRYIGVNHDLLIDADHLGHFKGDELRQVMGSFLRACILAVPGARKNSMSGFNPPDYVLGLVRSGQPMSLANSFEKPVFSNNGYLEASITALRDYYRKFKAAYNLESFESDIPSVDLDTFVREMVDHVC